MKAGPSKQGYTGENLMGAAGRTARYVNTRWGACSVCEEHFQRPAKEHQHFERDGHADGPMACRESADTSIQPIAHADGACCESALKPRAGKTARWLAKGVR